MPEIVELPNGAFTEFRAQLFLQGYYAGIEHVEKRDRQEVILTILVFGVFVVCACAFPFRKMPCSKRAPKDPFVETLVAVEEGRLECQEGEAVHGFLPERVPTVDPRGSGRQTVRILARVSALRDVERACQRASRA